MCDTRGIKDRVRELRDASWQRGRQLEARGDWQSVCYAVGEFTAYSDVLKLLDTIEVEDRCSQTKI